MKRWHKIALITLTPVAAGLAAVFLPDLLHRRRRVVDISRGRPRRRAHKFADTITIPVEFPESRPEATPEAQTIPPEMERQVRPLPAAEPAKFVTAKGSKTYHRPDCRIAENIKPENKIFFGAEAATEFKDFKPCQLCKPELLSTS